MKKYYFIGGVGLLLLAIGFGIYKYNTKTDYLGKFQVSIEKMTKDMDGKMVTIGYSQIWTFENNQNINISLHGKKQVDEFVVLVGDIKATAKFAETKKELPSKVNLKGLAKFTYEYIGTEWYLISVDSLNLKAEPVMD